MLKLEGRPGPLDKKLRSSTVPGGVGSAMITIDPLHVSGSAQGQWSSGLHAVASTAPASRSAPWSIPVLTTNPSVMKSLQLLPFLPPETEEAKQGGPLGV